MPDPTDIVQRLRWAESDTADPRRTIFGDAATAIETLLAQQKALVKEVEAWRRWHDAETNSTGMIMELTTNVDKARAATDAAFSEGLPK